MNKLKKVTISIPTQFFESGLTEAQLHGLVNRWLVISLFQQGNITSTKAGQLLTTDRDGFLSMLDKLDIIYEDAPEDEPQSLRLSPILVELDKKQSRLEVLEEELAEAKYQLFEAKKQLREADRVASEFIATVTHELRTPLNSIIGFAKLLLNQTLGTLNEIQHTDLSIIYSSAQHLLGLVNDILDISRIDAGKIRLTMEWVTIEEIVAGVMHSALVLIGENPVELRERIEPNLPKVYVDRGRIRQVIDNLLSNAAKFTNAGTITLRVYKITKDSQDWVCCSVTDTGIGIATEDTEKVFETFRQVGSTAANLAEGSGLGIPISRRLVELHGGELWFESKIGQGSTFFFTIPVEPPKNFKVDVVHVGMNQ